MKKLSRNEMKNVKGGINASPSCMADASNGSCWHNADWTSYECGLTQAQAQAHQGGFWCTASCSTSCYNNGDMTGSL